MAEAKQPRLGISINLNDRARAATERLREDTGIPTTEMVARILEWFTSLPVKLQLSVLNRQTDVQSELLPDVLIELLGQMPEDRYAELRRRHDEGLRALGRMLDISADTARRKSKGG